MELEQQLDFFNIEAEKCVLGFMFTHPENAIDVKVDPGMYYSEVNARIAKAISNRIASGQGFDYALIAGDLQNDEAFKKEGGVDYFAQIEMGQEPFETYVAEIHEKFNQRVTYAAAKKLLSDLRTKKVNDAIGAFTAMIDGKTSSPVEDAERLDAVLERVVATSRRLKEGKSTIPGRLITGIYSVDKLHGGAIGGQLGCVMAERGGGKSSYAITAIKYHLLNKIPLYIWSGEQPNVSTGAKAIASFTDIWTRGIQVGEWVGDTILEPEVLAMIEQAKGQDIYLDQKQMSLAKLSMLIPRLKRMGIDTMMIDRIELMQDVRRAATPAAAIGDVCNSLRALCVQHDFNIIIFVQQKTDRNRKGVRPTLEDMFGNTQILGAITWCLAIYMPEKHGIQAFGSSSGRWEDYSTSGVAEIICLKSGDDLGDSTLVQFVGRSQYFREIPQFDLDRNDITIIDPTTARPQYAAFISLQDAITNIENQQPAQQGGDLIPF